MEQHLKRYFWVIQLGGVGVIAILAALAFSNVGSALLAPLSVVPPPAPAVKNGGGDQGANKARLTNLDNSRFAPKPKEDEAPAEDTPTEEEPPLVLDADDYPVSDLKVQLQGTMVSDDDRWSMALLYDQQSRASFRAKVGESFLDTVKIVRIERDRVVVDRDGRLEQIELGGEPGKGGPSAARGGLASKPLSSSLSKPSWSGGAGLSAKPSVAKKSPARPDKFAELKKGITKKSANSFEVSKSTLQTALKNPGRFKDGTRPVPKYENGKLSGFEITRMSGGSIFSELGMRNGDIITSINGKKIRSPNDALRMYQKLSTAKDIKIGFKRGGVEQENSYTIR